MIRTYINTIKYIYSFKWLKYFNIFKNSVALYLLYIFENLLLFIIGLGFIRGFPGMFMDMENVNYHILSIISSVIIFGIGMAYIQYENNKFDENINDEFKKYIYYIRYALLLILIISTKFVLDDQIINFNSSFNTILIAFISYFLLIKKGVKFMVKSVNKDYEIIIEDNSKKIKLFLIKSRKNIYMKYFN